MSSKRETGHLKITTPDDFRGERLLPRDLNIELDGQRFEAVFDLNISVQVRDVVRATLGFYPASLEIDGPAMTLFGELVQGAGTPRARPDITPREWDAWEWRDVSRADDVEAMFVRVHPKS